jgi:hypothetical protein
MQASKKVMQQNSRAPHSGARQRPLAAALLLAAALVWLPHSAQAFNFDDLEKVEKTERTERKVREAKAEAARREDEARRQAQQQADDAAKQRAASNSGSSGGSGSSGRQVDRSKFILVPDGNRYKLHCGSVHTGFVTFMHKNNLGQWSSTSGGLRDTFEQAAYEAAKDNSNCWK